MKTISTTITNGVQTVFPVSFTLGYIDKAHVFVYTDNNVYTEQTGYVWINDTTIETTSVLPAGTKLNIRRVVNKTQLINDYTNDAILDELNLDNSFKQAMMWLEEIEDGFVTTDDVWVIRMSIQMLGDLDMNNHRITNLPEPVGVTEPLRLSDFYRLLQEADALIKVVGTSSTSFSVGESDHTKHYICMANDNITVVANPTTTVEATGKSVLIFFTQVGNGVITVTGAEGVNLVHPEDSTPTTYSRGSTIGLLAISNNSWVVVGNLGY